MWWIGGQDWDKSLIPIVRELELGVEEQERDSSDECLNLDNRFIQIFSASLLLFPFYISYIYYWCHAGPKKRELSLRVLLGRVGEVAVAELEAAGEHDAEAEGEPVAEGVDAVGGTGLLTRHPRRRRRAANECGEVWSGRGLVWRDE